MITGGGARFGASFPPVTPAQIFFKMDLNVALRETRPLPRVDRISEHWRNSRPNHLRGDPVWSLDRPPL